MLKLVLTLIPFIWYLAAFPFVNKVTPFILGLPFLAFWLVAGVFITSGCIAAMRSYDDRNSADGE